MHWPEVLICVSLRRPTDAVLPLPNESESDGDTSAGAAAGVPVLDCGPPAFDISVTGVLPADPIAVVAAVWMSYGAWEAHVRIGACVVLLHRHWLVCIGKFKLNSFHRHCSKL